MGQKLNMIFRTRVILKQIFKNVYTAYLPDFVDKQLCVITRNLLQIFIFGSPINILNGIISPLHVEVKF